MGLGKSIQAPKELLILLFPFCILGLYLGQGLKPFLISTISPASCRADSDLL